MFAPRVSTKSIVLLATLSMTWFVMGCHHAGSNNNDECSEGDIESCVGKGDCDGTRSCNDSGEYGKCVCDETGESTGTNTSTNTGNEPEPLGTSCSEDSDCPKGAICLTTESTSWLGGAPTEGLCVANCSEDDSVCDHFAGATCVESNRQTDSNDSNVSTALCLPNCSPDNGSLDEPACEATPGSLCEPLSADGTGVCRPVCNFDEQCASGHCDRQWSVCVAKETHYEVAFGTNCDPDASTCDGVCLTLSTGYSVCSHRCRFGSAEECGSSSASGLTAVCAFAAPDGGLGDLGYCAELCDCDDDCSHKDFVCEAFPNASLRTDLGHQGICTAPVDSIGETHEGTVCTTNTP
jgi:hypothetical protein